MSIDWKINCFSTNQRLVIGMNIKQLQLDIFSEFLDYLLEDVDSVLTEPGTETIVDLQSVENS